MTDHEDHFSTRVTEVLRGTTAAAPLPPALAASARDLRRSRIRRRFSSGIAVGAVVAAVALAVTLPGGSADRTPAPAGPASVMPNGTAVPEGFRTETYQGIEMIVPQSWGYGDLSQWCLFPDPLLPVFDRPGVSTMVACGAGGGYGVRFVDPQDLDLTVTDGAFREGAAIRTKTVGKLAVLVVLADAELADRIIASVHAVDGFDANGCADTEAVPEMGLAATVGAARGPVSVCRYSGTGNAATIIQSERLDEPDSAAVRAALASAPRGVGPGKDAAPCVLAQSQVEAVVFRTLTGPLAWVHYADCGDNGVDLGGSTRKLTGDVLYWAFSPGWSGMSPINVDLRLRQ